MMAKWSKIVTFFILVTMTGCSGFPFKPGANTPPGTQVGGQTPVPSSSVTPEAVETLAPTTTAVTGRATQVSSGSIVRIWLPPEFDTKGSNPAGGLLKDRLASYTAGHPGVSVEVRVKALEGTGGMLESLIAANAAAPQVLPDLVLLPRPLLESAAFKGLLYPYDGLTNLMDDQHWFEYARQLAYLKSSLYGVPFAGDAMVLAIRPSLLGVAPHSLEAAIGLGEVLLYPAADPQALFTLCMYLANGGATQDQQGRPAVDEAALTGIFEYDQRASLAGVMPVALTDYTNDAQVWAAFSGNPYPMTITWASTYLKNTLPSGDEVVLAALPTPDGIPFTLATGWSWALAGADPERRRQSVDLVEYLVEEDFLAEWTSAVGYLPPRVDALQIWLEGKQRQVIEQISYSAWLMPSEDLVSSIGPALEQAVVNVLKAQSEPQSAAQSVTNQVNQP